MISLASGLALLTASELAGLVSVRILAVALLLVGGIGVGLAANRHPGTAAGLKRLTGFFPPFIFGVIAVILAAPVLIALVASLIGTAIQSVDFRAGKITPLLFLGAAVGLALLALTVAALVIGIHAILGKLPGNIEEEQA